MDEDAENPELPPQQASRMALSEMNDSTSEEVSPNRVANAEELLIMHRGPWRKPITWSPVDYDRIKIWWSPKEKVPEAPIRRKSDIHPRLRKRLVMTPEKNPSQQLGYFVTKKLKSLNNLEKALN